MGRSPERLNNARRWIALGLLLLVVVMVPFWLVGEPIQTWTEQQLAHASARPGPTALLLGGLLATDVLLPVPSSLVSTACGWLLGAGMGTLVSLTGMTISCLFGYGLGLFARPLAQRLLGADNATGLRQLSDRHGTWMILITRPIPVLAEAAVLVAGSVRLPLGRFLGVSLLANLGVSAVYAVLGELGGAADRMLPSFGVAILLTGLALLARHRLLPKPPAQSPTPATPAN